MSRRYDPTDIIVAVGLCAIVFGGYLLFVAANGTLQAATSEPATDVQPSGMVTGMMWLQPVLGQAILDEYLLEREASRAIAATAKELNRATMAQHWLQRFPLGPHLEQVIATAARTEAEHAARVQGVMGRSIVNFTRRGVRSGVLSADQYTNDFNERMIQIAQAMGHRLDEEFQATWQSHLGGAIVAARQQDIKTAEQVQESIGHAAVQVAATQNTYEEASAANQQQLAGGIVAAVRTDAVADQLARLAAAEPKHGGEPVAFTEPASWPEIPMGYLVAAVLGLAGVFCGGLSLASASKEAKAMAEMKRDTARWVYRMAG